MLQLGEDLPKLVETGLLSRNEKFLKTLFIKIDFFSQIVVPKDIKIYAKLIGGGSVPVDIQNTSTLDDVKTVVESLDIVSPKKVKVILFSILNSNFHILIDIRSCSNDVVNINEHNSW